MSGPAPEALDDMLGRKGRMADAVAGIGKGEYACPSAPFELSLKA